MNEFSEDDVFQTIRFQIRQLYEVVRESEERKQRQWTDDVVALRAYINALSATRKVLQKEQTEVLQRIDYNGNKPAQVQRVDKYPAREELEAKLEEFGRKLREIDLELRRKGEEVNKEERTEEREMLQDQIIVIQGTKKLCLEEVRRLETMLQEIQMVENWKKQQSTDWANLARLKRQLTKVETKIDCAKRSLLFPSVHGYRFRAGSAGVYVGAKDLYISDFNASISLSLEALKRTIDGEKVGVIRLHMGGHEGRQIPNPKTETDSDDGNENSLSNEETKTETSTSISSFHTISSLGPPSEAESGRNQDPVVPSSLADSHSREASDQSVNLLVQEEDVELDQSAMTEKNESGSKGKSMAVNFLKKISDKEQIQKKMAKASQLLRGTSGRKNKLETKFKPSLFKKLVLPPRTPHSTSVSILSLLSGADGFNSVGTLPGNSTTTSEVLQESDTVVVVHQDGVKARQLEEEESETADTVSVGTSENYQETMSLGPSENERSTENQKFTSTRRNGFFGLSETQSSASDLQSESMSLIGAGRKGVHVKLKGKHVNLFGEKGTRVPNLTVAEIDLEVECCLSVLFEYSEKLGWTSPSGLKLQIIQLKKTTVGNSIPLPAGLVKTLLNLILPKIVERALISSLPKELGMYLIKSEKGMMTSGEVTVVGPPLCTTQAPLNISLEANETKPAKASFLKTFSAVQEAQNLLSLDAEEAGILGWCFSREQSVGLLDGLFAWNGKCSISELCSFYDYYSKSEIWLALCDLWNKAIGYIVKSKQWNLKLDFKLLMNGPVAKLAAKPVRTHCVFTRLNSQISVDTLLCCLREYGERSAKELHAEKSTSVTLPLDEQLEGLENWYGNITTKLRNFKNSFKSCMAVLVSRADSNSLQIGLEKLKYEGPLSFQIPVVRDSQNTGLLSFDLSIPSPEDSRSSKFTSSLFRALRGLHILRQERKSMTEELQTGSHWDEGTAVDDQLTKALIEGSKEEENHSFGETPSVGKVFLRHVKTAVALNEEQLTQRLLNGSHEDTAVIHVDQLKGLFEKMNDLLVCDFARDSNDSTKYQLQFQNTDLARFKCHVDTMGFQSSISPAEILSMLHICIKEYFLVFYPTDSARLKSLDNFLRHIAKYIDKRSLDVILCAKLKSCLLNNTLLVSLSELNGGTEHRDPIQITNDFDIISLMDTFSLAQGDIEA